MKILWLLLGLVVCLPGEAAEIAETPGCVPARAAAAYRRQFQLKAGGFGQWDLCREEAVSKKLLSALHTLEAAEFSEEDEPAPLSLKVSDEADYDYLRARVRHLHRNGCNGGDSVVACVRPGERTIHLQDYFFALPAVNRVATLLHEARHVDGFPHVDCEEGPLAGSGGGCDPDVKYRGSYAVELAYYARVALRGKNFHPAYRALARASAVSLMEQNFVRAPAAPSERLALIDKEDGHLILFDGRKTAERRGVAVNDAKLIARNYGLAVLPLNRALDTWLVDPYALSPLPPNLLESLLGSTFRSYNKLAPAERPPIEDILNRRDLQARLYPGKLEVMLHPENGDLEPTRVELATGSLGILGFAAANLCWRPDPFYGRPKVPPVQLLGRGGKIYQTKNLRSFEEPPRLEELSCSLPAGLVSTVEFGGRFLGLLETGEIVELPRDGGEAKPFGALSGIRAAGMAAFTMYGELEAGLAR